MTSRRTFNPKRRIGDRFLVGDQQALDHLAQVIRYGGSPLHKRNPGDFGLTPPASPRQGKSLCDDARIFTRAEAQRLLAMAMRRGMVDARSTPGGWPPLIWAVSDDGWPLEAESDTPGSYHGYPMPLADAFREEVLRVWQDRGP